MAAATAPPLRRLQAGARQLGTKSGGKLPRSQRSDAHPNHALLVSTVARSRNDTRQLVRRSLSTNRDSQVSSNSDTAQTAVGDTKFLVWHRLLEGFDFGFQWFFRNPIEGGAPETLDLFTAGRRFRLEIRGLRHQVQRGRDETERLTKHQGTNDGFHYRPSSGQFH